MLLFADEDVIFLPTRLTDLTDRYFLRDYFTADLPFPPISYNLCSLQRDVGEIGQRNGTKGYGTDMTKKYL